MTDNVKLGDNAPRKLSLALQTWVREAPRDQTRTLIFRLLPSEDHDRLRRTLEEINAEIVSVGPAAIICNVTSAMLAKATELSGVVRIEEPTALSLREQEGEDKDFLSPPSGKRLGPARD